MRWTLVAVAAIVLSTSGCAVITRVYVERLADSLDDLGRERVLDSYVEADASRIVVIRYKNWRREEVRVLGFQVPARGGRTPSTREALKTLPDSVPARYAPLRWILGSLAVPFTFAADLVLMPIVPLNIHLAAELGILRFAY